MEGMGPIKKKVNDVFNSNKNNDDSESIAYEKLEDKVYNIIAQKVIYHELKPGERIIDKQLAEDIGVSRSLVRQVLNILEKEELVENVPRRGFYVKKMTRDDIKEIYDIRKFLEVLAMEQAIFNISDEEISYVERIFDKAKEELKTNNVQSTVEADIELHWMINRNCGNKRLVNLIKKYSNLYLFYRIVDLSRIERAHEAYEEHYNILKAINLRDKKVAVELMRNHVENAKKIILKNFDEYTYGNNLP